MPIHEYNQEDGNFDHGRYEPSANIQQWSQEFLTAIANGQYQVVEPGTEERKYFGGYTNRDSVVVIEVEHRASLEGVPIEIPGENRSRIGTSDDFTATSKWYWSELRPDKDYMAMFQLDSFHWIKFSGELFSNPQRDDIVAEMRRMTQLRDRMRREAELDPEGAFGGRGNNLTIGW